MPLRFLEDIPREIRDQIYTYALASPSGAVTLSPWTIEVARSLSLLRTCKRIHRECKDIIWQHNGLSLREPSELFGRFRKMDARVGWYIGHMEIHLELLDQDELEWMSNALKGLTHWSRAGKLSCITLIAVKDRPRSINEFHDVLRLRRIGDRVDGRLYQDLICEVGLLPEHDRARVDCMSPSERWMVIDTAWPRFSHWGKQMWLREMLLDPPNSSHLLREIHHIFGGELYVDGILCFKDYVQVPGVIQLDAREGVVKILPAIII